LFLLLLLLLFDLNSHSLDHNGGTTNDDNDPLLILLNKQGKWAFFVIHLLLPRFSFSLYWTLCHVCVSVILSLRLSYSYYNKMVSCWYHYDGTLFWRKYKKRSGYSKYRRWWVCTWQLFVCNEFLSFLSVYIKYRMSIYDLH